MTYTPTVWTNEAPETSPVKYAITDDTAGVVAASATIAPVTSITPGTALNATNLNKMENGIKDAADAAAAAAPGLLAGFSIILGNGGDAIISGVKGFIEAPFAFVIERVALFADASGSIVVDIWKVPYTSFPPTSGNSITASARPTLSSAQKYQDATLTGWTTSIAKGDILAFNVVSATTVKQVTVALSGHKVA